MLSRFHSRRDYLYLRILTGKTSFYGVGLRVELYDSTCELKLTCLYKKPSYLSFFGLNHIKVEVSFFVGEKLEKILCFH